jgi:uncharacterized membrane protein YcaP (DUF421 family)
MFTSILRAIILYIIILIVLRLMGKRQLGEMQPFEFVITLIIADLTCIPMADISIPILHGIIPLLTLVLLHFMVSLLSRKSITMRKVFNGKPIIVIDPNGIRYEALKSLNMTLNDLCEGLRACEYFSFDEVAYAIVETNGNLSVLAKSSAKPATAEDAKIKTDESTLSVILINDGKVLPENLQYAGVDENFVNKLLKDNDVKSPKDMLVLTLDKLGSVYFQPKSGDAKTLQTKYQGGN